MAGGTIDSYYEGTKDTAVPNKESVIPDFIKSLKLYEKTVFTEICMKDSRDMTKNDLKKILNTIKKSTHKKIIITNGTYTIPDTARYLKVNLKRNDQTIVFTGSLIPLVGFSPSDAPFNLGYSIAKVCGPPARPLRRLDDSLFHRWTSHDLSRSILNWSIHIRGSSRLLCNSL